MRPRTVIVALVATLAFLGLYAAGQASEDSKTAELEAPASIDAPVGDTGAAPRLEAGGPLPGLRPRRPARHSRRPASPAPTEAEEPTEPEPTPVPAPAPAPVPAPAPSLPPAGGGGGKPFYDEG